VRGLQKGVRLLSLVGVVSAQSAAGSRPTTEVSDPWLNRARSLTDELVKDSEALGRYDRALLWARLGRAWQRDDAEQARAWAERAIQSVESGADEEDANERSQRLSAARSLLVILGAEDKALSARLDKLINDATEAAATPGGDENAQAKAEAALAALDGDPQRALQFGLASLRAGGSYKLASLLWRLRKRDVNLSDTLFMEIIAAARARGYEQNLLAILPVVTFEGPAPSDKLRATFLGVLAEGLLRAPNSAQEQSAICRLAPLAAPLLPEFQRLIPQQAGAVRAQLVVCQPSLDPQARREVGNSLEDETPNTVDDLLEAAGKTPDPGQRLTYRERAAYLAFNEQKYERAIAILDGLSVEEHELMDKTQGGLWDNWRSAFAASAAVARLRRGDRPAMYQIIAAAPPHLRASVQISVAAELVKKDAPAATQLLDEARAALAKTGSPQDFDPYLAIVRLYATLNSPDALPTLHDAIKAMNRTEQPQRDGGADAADAEARIPLLSNDLLLARYSLPVSLMTLDDVGVRQAVASVAAPARRAAVRLSLLGASLEQRRAATPKPVTGSKGKDKADQ
jgi:hypothetical protein